jgi:hypothetical protein
MGGAALTSFLSPIIIPSLSSSKRLCRVVPPVAGTLVLNYGTYLPIPRHDIVTTLLISIEITLGIPPHHLQWN